MDTWPGAVLAGVLAVLLLPALVYVCVKMGTLGYLRGRERYRELRRPRDDYRSN